VSSGFRHVVNEISSSSIRQSKKDCLTLANWKDRLSQKAIKLRCVESQKNADLKTYDRVSGVKCQKKKNRLCTSRHICKLELWICNITKNIIILCCFTSVLLSERCKNTACLYFACRLLEPGHSSSFDVHNQQSILKSSI
jgi:hypothetical protein